MPRPGLLVRYSEILRETRSSSKNTSSPAPSFSEIYSLTFAIFSAVFGPKLGMRAMVLSRFSWGYVSY